MENGFLITLSGEDHDSRSWSGVGIIVAPWMKKHVKTYQQVSDRLMYMKLACANGVVGLICGYAPHNGWRLDERMRYFQQMDEVYRKCAGCDFKFICGDLNARVGYQHEGEAEIVGGFGFGREVRSSPASAPNRDLLLELCGANCLSIAHTFIDAPLHEKVTFMEVGTTPYSVVTESAFNVLDMFLCNVIAMPRVRRLRSIREAALATDHFLVTCVFDCHLESKFRHSESLLLPHISFNAKATQWRHCLQEKGVADTFVETFTQHLRELTDEGLTVESRWDKTIDAITKAESSFITEKRRPNKVWISEATMKLIDERQHARKHNHHHEEKRLHKLVRESVRRDKTNWLDDAFARNDWAAIRNVRRPRQPKKVKLRDHTGRHVESHEWADTMAHHLETTQWRRRCTADVDGPLLGPELPISMDPFSVAEVRQCISELRRGKATGIDHIPGEYLQALSKDETSLAWITDLCTSCFLEKRVPSDWQLSQVTCLYKKGAVDDCGNYRPISLLSVVYKLFAKLILKRLQDGGAEDRLHSFQFGFRRETGTADAIFCIRRQLDLAWAFRDSKAAMLALDWKMAFDSVNPEILALALKRFGLNAHLVDLISNIYAERRFVVAEGGHISHQKPQLAGISQGCPLSPFLFILVMTVVLEDSIRALKPEDQAKYNKGDLSALLYADDTLLIGGAENSLQHFLDSIANVGSKFGFELHWGKFQFMRVRNNFVLVRPDGTQIPASDIMTYLGVNLHADGTMRAEVRKRIALAWKDFCSLARLWNHSFLPLRRKLQIFGAIISSRLLYGLASAWLNVAELRRLDGFQARCLRKMLRVSPAFISRVSNKSILGRSGARAYSAQLLQQQMLFLGKVARSSQTSLMRTLTFDNVMLRPLGDCYVRRCGRPRNEWASMLLREALKMCGSQREMERKISDPVVWEAAVWRHTHVQNLNS